MRIISLGASDVIGASCHYINIGGTGIMIDAGADPEHDGPEALPALEVLQKRPDLPVDHVIITHAHHDHLGSLPVVIQRFPHVQVHMTRTTQTLAAFLLPASARLQRRKQREGSTPFDPLFSEAELEVQDYLHVGHELETPFDVTGTRGSMEISAAFYDAGHIIGSAGVLFRWHDGVADRSCFFTSDTHPRDQTIIPGGVYPPGPVDVLMLESTLGADPYAEQTTRRAEEKKLLHRIRTVIDDGGTILIPVFALGRAQEVLALIDVAKRRGWIPEDLPVYTAGSQRAIADIYDRTRFTTPRKSEKFQVWDVRQERLPRGEGGKKEALSKPGIFVVSSGMMFEPTISFELARHVMQRPKNAILLVGYAQEDSPADRLLEAYEAEESVVRLTDKHPPEPMRCHVEKFRLSGHANRRDLLKIAETLQPKHTYLVHGDADAQVWMADNLVYHDPDMQVYRNRQGVEVEIAL
jgi:cleavage and polyadenylation specificity factor subunit 3